MSGAIIRSSPAHASRRRASCIWNSAAWTRAFGTATRTSITASRWASAVCASFTSRAPHSSTTNRNRDRRAFAARKQICSGSPIAGATRVRHDAPRVWVNAGKVEGLRRSGNGGLSLHVRPIEHPVDILVHGVPETFDRPDFERRLRAVRAPIGDVHWAGDHDAVERARELTDLRGERYVAFVRADTQLEAGWLDELLARVTTPISAAAATFADGVETRSARAARGERCALRVAAHAAVSARTHTARLWNARRVNGRSSDAFPAAGARDDRRAPAREDGTDRASRGVRARSGGDRARPPGPPGVRARSCFDRHVELERAGVHDQSATIDSGADRRAIRSDRRRQRLGPADARGARDDRRSARAHHLQ